MTSCLPFQLPFSQNSLKPMKAGLRTTSIGCGSEKPNKVQGGKPTEVRSPTPADPNLHPPRYGATSVLCAVFTAGVSGSTIAETPSTPFAKGCADKSEVLSLLLPQSPGFQTSANGKPFCSMCSPISRYGTRPLCCSHTMGHYAAMRLCACALMTSTGTRIRSPSGL